MKTNSILMFVVFLFLLPIMLAAQTKDLFAFENGNIIPKREFFSSLAKESTPFGNFVEVYVHKNVVEGFVSPVNDPITISFVGTSKMDVDGTYDAFRIFTKDGRKLLEYWGYNPLRSVEGQNMQPYCNVRYIKIPLDNDMFALIFGGVLFDGDSEAPEMIIVVVKENQARVVFDRPAMSFKYLTSPNFSMEFIEEMDWKSNNFGNDDTPYANPISSRTKYKIWKEGNMLKYTSWK